jgi:hypothetical protein
MVTLLFSATIPTFAINKTGQVILVVSSHPSDS